MKGYIHNNLGINHFYQFVDKSTTMNNKEGASEATKQSVEQIAGNSVDKIGEMIVHLDSAIRELKNSVRSFENYDHR